MGHWYKKDGEPLYKVNKVGSKEKRDTTLADAKKLKLVPSVTGVTGILAKPYIDKWKTDILLGTVIGFPIRENENPEDYLDRIKGIARGKQELAANRGTEIHDKLEDYFHTGKIDTTDSKFLVPTLNLLSYEFNGKKWISEESFAHTEGFGGKIDLYAKEGNGVIVDFKTKAKDVLDKKVLYDDYCMQLAAYRLGLQLPDATCYNLVISTTNPGTLYLHKWSEEELKESLKKFRLLLQLWKMIHNYDSGWKHD